MRCRKKRVLFLTFNTDLGGPQRWLDGLLGSATMLEFDVDVWRLKVPKFPYYWELLQELRSKLKGFGPDVVYINHDLRAACLVACFCRLLGFSNVIAHSRNSSFGGPNGLALKVCQFLLRRVVKQKVAISTEAARAMFSVADQSTIYIPSFIDFEQLANESLLAPEWSANDTFSGVTFGCIGRLAYQKNQELLINAFKPIVAGGLNARLLLIGHGEREDEFRAMVKEYNLVESVIFVGAVGDVAAWYRHVLDVLLVPSRYEGQGRIVAEGQFFGLPVVASPEVPDVAFLFEEDVCQTSSLLVEEWIDVIISIASTVSKDRNRVPCIERARRSPLSLELGVLRVRDCIVSVLNT